MKFIYFDLGNVLLTFDHEIGFSRMAELAGVSVAQVKQVMQVDDLQNQYERGELTSQQVYDEFCSRTSSQPDKDELLLAASDIFELNTPVIPIVVSLLSARNRIGILSNTCEAHWQFITKTYRTINSYFHPHVLSYEVCSMKPDAKIYAEAAAMAQVEPTEIIFFDDREENVAGASEAGFDAIQFTSAKQMRRELMARDIPMNG